MGEAGTSDHMGPESGGTDPRGDRNGGSGEGMAGPANYQPATNEVLFCLSQLENQYCSEKKI